MLMFHSFVSLPEGSACSTFVDDRRFSSSPPPCSAWYWYYPFFERYYPHGNAFGINIFIYRAYRLKMASHLGYMMLYECYKFTNLDIS